MSEYAIKRLKEVENGLRESIGSFPHYYLVPLWRKNLKDIEGAIMILKADQKKRKK